MQHVSSVGRPHTLNFFATKYSLYFFIVIVDFLIMFDHSFYLKYLFKYVGL
jgi:hypothetical protein